MGSKIVVSLFLGLCIQSIASHILMHHHNHMMFPMFPMFPMHRPTPTQSSGQQTGTSSRPSGTSAGPSGTSAGPSGTSAAPALCPTPLGGDTQSSFCVVDQLCSLPDSTIAPIAQEFGSGCYDAVPKEHFAACQNQIFGCTWDTLDCIKTNCPRFHDVYQSYVNCIVGRFTAANLTIATLFESGTHINQCQGALVGL